MDALPTPLAALPRWQRSIVALILSGVERYQAAAQLHVSPSTVQQFMLTSHAFAKAVTDAEDGVLGLGVEDARGLAVSHAGAMIEDAVAASRNEDVKPRDQFNNRKLVVDAALGQPALTVVWQPQALAFFQAFTSPDAPPLALGDGTGTAGPDPQSAPPREEKDALQESKGDEQHQ